MPQVRGWTEYALDPREDGAVTQPGSNAPMGLAVNHPQNTDALVLRDWWEDSGTPGQEAEDIVLYKGEIKGTGGPSKSAYYTDYLLDEAVSPDIYIKTGMADYVPNMFNLFVDENGHRMDPAYIKGTGFSGRQQKEPGELDTRWSRFATGRLRWSIHHKTLRCRNT